MTRRSCITHMEGEAETVPDPQWDPVVGYFVEYNVIPEPSTALLLGVGLGAMALRRRHRTDA